MRDNIARLFGPSEIDNETYIGYVSETSEHVSLSQLFRGRKHSPERFSIIKEGLGEWRIDFSLLLRHLVHLCKTTSYNYPRR